MMELYKGDCLEVMKTIESGSIDAVITDPPYGTTACKWDSVIDFKLMWEQLNRIIKPNGAIVLFGSQPFTSSLIMSNPKNFKYEWIWEKSKSTGHLLAKKRPMKCHENIVVFYKKLPSYNPQGVIKGEFNTSRKNRRKDSIYAGSNIQKEYTPSKIGNYPKTIQKFANPSSSNSLHPTQKPIALMEYLIKTYTNEGEIVLDFTMGSGSTGVAAKNLNRNFIGIEQDDKYFEIAKQRINEQER